MARELLSTRTYHRYDHPNYPFDDISPSSTIVLIAHASGVPVLVPTRMNPDDRCMRIHISVLHNNMVLTPSFDSRTVLVPELDDPQGRVVYDFNLHYHCPRPHEFVEFVSNMLPLLIICPNARLQLLAHMPTFLSDVVVEAWRRGFSLLEIKAHVVQTVDINQTHIFYYSIAQIVDATTGAGAMEMVKGEAGKVCSVCLDEFMEGMYVSKLKLCLHVFHTMCIGRWLQQSLRNGRHGFQCPICRSTIEWTFRNCV